MPTNPKTKLVSFERLFEALDSENRGELVRSDFARPIERLEELLYGRARAGTLEAANDAQRELADLVFLCVDRDRSGSVSRAEFLVFEQMLADQAAEHEGQAPPWVRDYFRALFDLIDTDGSGDVDSEEFSLLARAFGIASDTTREFAALTGERPRLVLADLDARVGELFGSDDPDAPGHSLVPRRG
jgi:hypothetical protein